MLPPAACRLPLPLVHIFIVVFSYSFIHYALGVPRWGTIFSLPTLAWEHGNMATRLAQWVPSATR
jgi:hypothetical protein